LNIAIEERVIIWDMENKKNVQELPSSFIHSSRFDLSIHFFSLKFVLENSFCCGLNWSRDGKTLFSGCTHGGIIVWELITLDFS